MNTLAVDTSLSEISAAVQCDGRSWSRTFRHERDALRRLARIIEEVLSDAALGPGSIQVVACTSGPGSFTGLRVGIAAAKAFADAAGARMVAVSTLEALAAGAARTAEGLHLAGTAIPMVECCPGELYCGAFRVSEHDFPRRVAPDISVKAESFATWVAGLPSAEGAFAIGPAARKYQEQLAGLPVRECCGGIDILDVLRLGEEAWGRGEYLSPIAFQPEYLRASQAEVRAAERSLMQPGAVREDEADAP